jgi:hypothetical protein
MTRTVVLIDIKRGVIGGILHSDTCIAGSRPACRAAGVALGAGSLAYPGLPFGATTVIATLLLTGVAFKANPLLKLNQSETGWGSLESVKFKRAQWTERTNGIRVYNRSAAWPT